jgi:hypothetical protein
MSHPVGFTVEYQNGEGWTRHGTYCVEDYAANEADTLLRVFGRSVRVVNERGAVVYERTEEQAK